MKKYLENYLDHTKASLICKKLVFENETLKCNTKYYTCPDCYFGKHPYWVCILNNIGFDYPDYKQTLTKFILDNPEEFI